jgi:hypothetical protein
MSQEGEVTMQNGKPQHAPAPAPAAAPQRERLDVFTIVERENAPRPFWVKLGTAFQNKDGSFNIYLDALPVNGKLQIRTAERRESDAAND